MPRAGRRARQALLKLQILRVCYIRISSAHRERPRSPAYANWGCGGHVCLPRACARVQLSETTTLLNVLRAQ
eukprot:2201326-Lingulodinium_polyedra.AAC.1